MDGLMDRWTDGRMDGWMDGWMDGVGRHMHECESAGTLGYWYSLPNV